MTGILELRSKIAAHYSKRDNRTLSADDVIIGPGSKELLYLVQLACQDSTSFTVGTYKFIHIVVPYNEIVLHRPVVGNISCSHDNVEQETYIHKDNI